MPNISIDRRYWVEDSVPRAWPPGADVFTGENNPKANYALDLNIDGQTMTFIPSSTINNGVYSPFSDTRVSGKSYYMPWFLDPNNQQQLAEVGKKVDLSKSDVGGYLKDKMGASTDGILIPKGSLPFDSQIVNAPGKVQGMGSINGQPVYINEDINKTGQTYFTDAAGQTKSYVPSNDDGGLFGGFFGDVVGGVNDIWQSLGPIGKIAALYYGGSALGEAIGGMSPEAIAASDAASAAADSEAMRVTAGIPDIGSLPTPGPGVQLAGGTTETALSSLASPENAYTAAQDAQDALAMTGNPAANASLTGVAAIGAGNAYPALNAAAAGEAAAAGSTPAQIAAAAGAGANAANAANTITGSAIGDAALISGGTGLVGAKLSSDAAQKAADTQTAAANAAIAQQQKNFETISQQQAPYRATGYNALNEIAKLGAGQTPQYDYLGNIVKDASGNPVMTTGSGYLTHQFTPQDFAAGIDPGYAFRLQQGQMANQRAANVAGGALSGNTLKGLQDYTQGLASTEYGNAFDRYQKQRQNIYNTLASIAGIGQTGQTATNTAATNATNAATQLGVGSAAAQAAGGVGSAQAYTNAINNAANNYTLASLLNQRGNVAMPVQG